jgi:thymidine kinase
MPVTNVACPNCGEKANATVNSKSDEIADLSTTKSKGIRSGSREYESRCSECNGKFYYDLE